MESTPGSWAGQEALSPNRRAQTPLARTPGLDLEVASPEPGTLRLRLQGGLDARSAPAFKHALAELLSEGPSRIVLDLSALKRLDPTGLAALAEAGEMAKRCGQRLVVAHLPPSARKRLARASLHKIIPLSEA
ncbi:STAS domain-containing protein [bacterium]|nr:STAS domain-containing protein [bacterium]